MSDPENTAPVQFEVCNKSEHVSLVARMSDDTYLWIGPGEKRQFQMIDPTVPNLSVCIEIAPECLPDTAEDIETVWSWKAMRGEQGAPALPIPRAVAHAMGRLWKRYSR